MSDSRTNERLELKYKKSGFNIDESLERIKEAGNIKDTALVVTHEALPLLSAIIHNGIQEIVRTELEKATKEFGAGMLEAMNNMINNQVVNTIEPDLEPEPEPEPEPSVKTSRRKWTEQELYEIESHINKGLSPNLLIQSDKLKSRTPGAIRTKYHEIKKEK